tara:strand:+ start:465 stop:815 length:351 start_codon:yes stop_codon:yes gene_type:complete
VENNYLTALRLIGDYMLFTLKEIKEAVDWATGDDGFRSNEVIEILKQTRKESAMKEYKRSLYEIVIDALQLYSSQANVESESFKKNIADKVYEDFCTEFYPQETTTADEYNKEYDV